MMEREFKDSGIEWIGRIPKEWISCRFKNFLELRTEPSTLETKIGLENIESESGHFIETEGKFEGNGVQFRKGEIVYGKLRPYLRKVWLASFEGNAVGDFFVFRNKSNANAKYLKWLLLSDGFTEAVNSSVYGAKMPRVSSDFILTLPYCIPPLPEQQRIADYLDKKCGEIDELIALQEQMITQLTDYKQSVITEAVTKGLNPDVELVPSGIDWIGDIPKHWGTPSISYLASISSGSTPDRNHPEYWNDGVINWIKTGELQNNKITDSEEKVTEYALNNTSIKLYPQNTILIAMYGQGKTRGMTALLDVPSTTNQACAALSNFNKSINYLYLWKCLIGAYNAIRDMAVGTGQPNLNIDLISKFVIPLPPYEEQTKIVEYIDYIVPMIDSLIALKQQKIETLKDYKKSVIYEAVTGKMSIGEMP